jgi:uncharacterized radical SAM superfamily Fe-S cluster-containing enzyme
MARLKEKDYTYFKTVRGMCRNCRKIVPARVFFRGGQVWQESLCPSCTNTPALIAADKNWYLANVLEAMPDQSPLPGAKPPKLGCPHDCGPCAWHATPCQLPVISITNACNLRCPICFTYNRQDRNYYKSIDEMKQTVDWLIESCGPLDLINITGGEPTLHPQLTDLLRVCIRPRIGQVTMNSNGIILADNYPLCEQLADLGICVVLSFNTFDSRVSRRLNGADLVHTKLKAIENLTRAAVRMTLLNVMVGDVNENAISGMLDLMRRNDNILSLTIQTMTYSGQGASTFARTRHVPVDKAAAVVSEQSGGMLELDDFVTKPSAHPLCYLICYMFKNGDELIPLTRFAPRDKIQRLIRDSYLIRPGSEEFFTDVINQLYAWGRTKHLGLFRQMAERLYPAGKALNDFERQRIGESFVRTLYIHAQMDEDTFDCSRAMLCPDQTPAEPGRLIGTCTYNLFHRMKDERFYFESKQTQAGRGV